MLQIVIPYLLAYNGLTTNTRTTNAGMKILKRTKRIVGGRMTQIENVPYLVNIRQNGVFECGGSLITSKCVLTAAHCIRNVTIPGVAASIAPKPQDFVVRAGVTNLNDFQNSHRRRVQAIFIPQHYNRTALNNDVAILKLRTPLNKNVNIETIELATEEPKIDDYIQVSGWGLINENATRLANHMRTVFVRIIEQEMCQQLYADYRNITNAMFCAALPGIADACSADSGGPAVTSNGKLLGIVSWGRGGECARINSPGVYVNVVTVRPWIESIMTKYCY